MSFVAFRYLVGVAVCIGAAGCAATGPAPTRSAAVGACPGLSVSGVVLDGARRVVGADAPKRVRGVSIARAPTTGCVSSGFGRRAPGRPHEGVDLYTGRPASVWAGADGAVTFVGRRRGYGLTVDVSHGDGVATRYAHLSRATVTEGVRVRRGDIIGRTGATGNATAVHLHYEILIDGRPVDPLR